MDKDEHINSEEATSDTVSYKENARSEQVADRICPDCGVGVRGDYMFCTSCGHKF